MEGSTHRVMERSVSRVKTNVLTEKLVFRSFRHPYNSDPGETTHPPPSSTPSPRKITGPSPNRESTGETGGASRPRRLGVGVRGGVLGGLEPAPTSVRPVAVVYVAASAAARPVASDAVQPRRLGDAEAARVPAAAPAVAPAPSPAPEPAPAPVGGRPGGREARGERRRPRRLGARSEESQVPEVVGVPP